MTNNQSRIIGGGYICYACAMENEAIAIEGHACTMHNGICMFCELEKGLAYTSDWNWPFYKPGLAEWD